MCTFIMNKLNYLKIIIYLFCLSTIWIIWKWMMAHEDRLSLSAARCVCARWADESCKWTRQKCRRMVFFRCFVGWLDEWSVNHRAWQGFGDYFSLNTILEFIFLLNIDQQNNNNSSLNYVLVCIGSFMC